MFVILTTKNPKLGAHINQDSACYSRFPVKKIKGALVLLSMK